MANNSSSQGNRNSHSAATPVEGVRIASLIDASGALGCKSSVVAHRFASTATTVHVASSGFPATPRFAATSTASKPATSRSPPSATKP